MPKTRKTSSFGKKNKWNINAFCRQLPPPGPTANNNPITTWAAVGGYYIHVVDLVPSATVGGTRKMKNVSLNFTTSLDVVYYCVAYVPEGTNPSNPTLSGEGYQPSQYVIMQGVISKDLPLRKLSRLARNLNENDKIALIFWTPNVPPITGNAYDGNDINAYCQYAICYN